MNEDKNIIREYSCEPVVGHRYHIEVYEPTTSWTKTMDCVYEDAGLDKPDRTKVSITESDVDWKENKSVTERRSGSEHRNDQRADREVTMPKEQFEELIGWFQGEP